MNRLVQKSLLCLFVEVVIVTFGCEGYLISHDPSKVVSFLPIPFVFLIMGVFLTLVLEFHRHTDDKQMVVIYMGLKVLKFFIMMLLFFAYTFLLKNHVIQIFLMIGIFYFAYLIYETGYFIKFEKSLKKEKNG
jgi:hypothetical protein